MQIGLISDIHGNCAALAEVWDALALAGLTQGPVLNAGDNVGYGPAPEACVQFLRAHANILNVQGNYDKNVALFSERSHEYQKKWGKSRPEKYEALRDGSEAISEKTRAWLLALPKEMTVMIAGTRVLLTHYAPGSKEGLGRWTSDDHLRELAGRTDAGVVVCGHTHSPFVRRADGVLFVNPGTVGRSWYGRASYAVLTIRPDLPTQAELKQVAV